MKADTEINKRCKTGYFAKWISGQSLVLVKQIDYNYEVEYYIGNVWISTSFTPNRRDAIWKAKQIMQLKGGKE